MEIVTDSKNLEDPKDPKTCNIFQIYKLIGTESEINDLKSKYENGGYGYGHAKMALLELIQEKYASPRKQFKTLMENPKKIELELEKGAQKARKIANSVLSKVKLNLGLM